SVLNARPTATLITPPYTQTHFELVSSAGIPPTCTVGDPGTHDVTGAGVQVPGVSTPSAAAVWLAVTGLARLLHSPNGVMLTIGALSPMLAIGAFSSMVLFFGRTISVDGARPNEHVSVAPFTTGSATASTVARRCRREEVSPPLLNATLKLGAEIAPQVRCQARSVAPLVHLALRRG